MNHIIQALATKHYRENVLTPLHARTIVMAPCRPSLDRAAAAIDAVIAADPVLRLAWGVR